MNKRDEQRKRKEEKQQAAEHQQKNQKLMVKFATFFVAPVILLFIAFTLFSQGPTYSTVEIADNDHLRGDTENPVSIVVYADFQCPACATENQTMTRLWPNVRDKALMIFRHFPLTATHPHSWTASLYAEAAGKQDRFWEMHDYLFATQAIWSGFSSADIDVEFMNYAEELGLDTDQLVIDMETDEVIQKIRNDQRGGNAAGVRSTPAVFINGRLLARPSRARIIEVVEEEYAASNSAG